MKIAAASGELRLSRRTDKVLEGKQGTEIMNRSSDRLIVALDVPDSDTALGIVRSFGETVSFYKIGLGLLAAGGLELAARLSQEFGKRLFLDMKLFDIGATVATAARGLETLGIDFLTVHGDPHVVRAAKSGLAGQETEILAVAVLTSLDRMDLDDALIVPGDIGDLVVERSLRAFAAGADGVICSPREAARIRSLPEAAGKKIVTPGVRPAGSAPEDQKRVGTPAQAIADGADHVVVGRPILRADDPLAAAKAILAELPPLQPAR